MILLGKIRQEKVTCLVPFAIPPFNGIAPKFPRVEANFIRYVIRNGEGINCREITPQRCAVLYEDLTPPQTSHGDHNPLQYPCC